MNNKKTISIYVRNKDITPSSYYRVVQYSKYFTGSVYIRELAPKRLYEIRLNSNKERYFQWMAIGGFYYFTMLIRAIWFLLIDTVKKPEYIIVSKTFCPRHTPLVLRSLIIKVAKQSKLIWDFDDHIVESREISKTQALVLGKYSKKIVVTNKFLRSQVESRYQDKVILLPTTDGGLQDFDKEKIRLSRKGDFDYRIKLIWVGTSNNLSSLIRIITELDSAARLLHESQNKLLELTVVSNKPLETTTKYLTVKNVKWTREIAKEKILDSHIGIMPLLHGEYALGKGGFKLVQYISTGLPVIASKIGFNNEIVNQDNGILVNDREDTQGWVEAINKLSYSWEEWERLSFNAYYTWKERFSFERNLEVWNNLLNS